MMKNVILNLKSKTKTTINIKSNLEIIENNECDCLFKCCYCGSESENIRNIEIERMIFGFYPYTTNIAFCNKCFSKFKIFLNTIN